MNEKYKNLKEKEISPGWRAEEAELLPNDLDQVSGGMITEKEAEWLTETIREGKAAGSTKERVAFYARISSGKGPLAHASGEEASKWVLAHWDLL